MPDKKKSQVKTAVIVETKLCPVCKRSFANRKRWRMRGQWELVKYCSDRCRKQVT